MKFSNSPWDKPKFFQNDNKRDGFDFINNFYRY